jgi:hypothetical protein
MKMRMKKMTKKGFGGALNADTVLFNLGSRSIKMRMKKTTKKGFVGAVRDPL